MFLNFKFDEVTVGWLEVLNTNIKWAITFLIRGITIVVLIIVVILLLKLVGVGKLIKEAINTDTEVKVETITKKSKPSTPTYENDIKDIEAVQGLLK